MPSTRSWFAALLTIPVVLFAGTTLFAQPPKAGSDGTASWVEPMKKVHASFKGQQGTLANFGDSITVTLAYWAPLQYNPKGMATDLAADLTQVKNYMRPECWDKWKGPEYGSNGSMTIRWADQNVDRWLKAHNPEAAVILFGTNDLGQLELAEFEAKTSSVVERCLKNGTVVLLTTLPPRHGQLDKAKRFAETVRRVARARQVPVNDFQAEILKLRPDDWDGALPRFLGSPGDEYQVPTLISRDGVHPSNPSKYQDYSAKSLRCNGYVLRNALTLQAYADVLRLVLRPETSGR